MAKENEIIEKAEHEIDPVATDKQPKASDGKLIVEEEVAVGHVTWSASKRVTDE